MAYKHLFQMTGIYMAGCIEPVYTINMYCYLRNLKLYIYNILHNVYNMYNFRRLTLHYPSDRLYKIHR